MFEEYEQRQVFKALRMFARLVDEEEEDDEDENDVDGDGENRKPTSTTKKSDLFLQALERRHRVNKEEKERFAQRLAQGHHKEDEAASGSAGDGKGTGNSKRKAAAKSNHTSSASDPLSTDSNIASPSSAAALPFHQPQIHPFRAFLRGDWWNRDSRRALAQNRVVRGAVKGHRWATGGGGEERREAADGPPASSFSLVASNLLQLCALLGALYALQVYLIDADVVQQWLQETAVPSVMGFLRRVVGVAGG